MKSECYGRMFPPVAALETNRKIHGKVFSSYLLSLGIQDRKVDADLSRWAACLARPEFDG